MPKVRYRLWEWSPHDEISAFIKGTPESSLTPSDMGGHSKKTVIYELGSGLSPVTESSGTLILDSQPPELWKINVCHLSHLVYGIFDIAAWKD